MLCVQTARQLRLRDGMVDVTFTQTYRRRTLPRTPPPLTPPPPTYQVVHAMMRKRGSEGTECVFSSCCAEVPFSSFFVFLSVWQMGRSQRSKSSKTSEISHRFLWTTSIGRSTRRWRGRERRRRVREEERDWKWERMTSLLLSPSHIRMENTDLIRNSQTPSRDSTYSFSLSLPFSLSLLSLSLSPSLTSLSAVGSVGQSLS